MGDDVRLRCGTDADREEILELMRLSLGEGSIPRSREFWSWKHEKNPFGPSPCLVATAQGRIIGLRVFMRWSWSRGGATFRAVRAVDTATHPDWRGRGIFSRLTRELLERMSREGVSFVFNTPNDKSRPGYLKMGWEEIGRVSLWARPTRPVRLLTSFLGGPDGSDDDGGEGDADASLGSDPGELFGRSEIDSFLRTVRTPADRFATPRTSAYMRWRYGEVPGIPYRASGEVRGSSGAVLVFRLKDRKGAARELRFCEFVVGADAASGRIARRLAKAILRDTEADFAAAMTVTGTRSTPILGRLGFAPAPRLGPIMTVRPLQETGLPTPALTRRSSWHTSIGDLELF